MIASILIVFGQQSQVPNVERQRAQVGEEIVYFSYKPKNYNRSKLIVVMHGTNRNAEEYCQHSKGLAEKYGAMVIAPLFDNERFPSWRYHRGGVVDSSGGPRLRSEWTYPMLERLILKVKMTENPKMKHWLIGHSAGGQFLNRMSAFYQHSAERVIVANPGSLIVPRNDWDFAYGFGKLTESVSNETALKAYLAQPMTLLLGDADNKPDENFDTSKAAMLQGGGRFQRGNNCFEYGRTLATKRGWKFGWKRVVVRGVGHDHEQMFGAPNIGEAFE
jgi:poly(3-hydroxybutyrate) depolymerase